MTTRFSPDSITALSETMLITLWAKATETMRANGILHDAEAVRMMGLIEYDFDKFTKAKSSQVGSCGRAYLIDNITRNFIAEHPQAVVVQLGAGLDARFERLGRPAIAAWYDLDLPEVIEVRRRLLPESSNHYVGASLFDETWADTVAKHGKPVLLILEGVLMYFEEHEVKAFFDMVSRKLPGTEVVLDILPKKLVGHAKQHDALSKMNTKPPEFKWGVAQASDLEQLHSGIKLLSQTGLSSICRKRYPWLLRLIYLTAWGLRNLDMQIVHLRVAGFQTGIR
ncbi:class I SAM-dependent methyltransferase [Neisseria sp. 83E34]|uniref:class I SAM-dependent methyltransferase n=1 Tax=Neisseria sp. 83E34 TaxID=1692264 RepID=UPI0006CEA7BE|nr:class I SAM-dependent methyltransferase [Neisseria sp. 83E34]KPN72072.1 methyltransferase [Neisseria sp. 83E34]